MSKFYKVMYGLPDAAGLLSIPGAPQTVKYVDAIFSGESLNQEVNFRPKVSRGTD